MEGDNDDGCNYRVMQVGMMALMMMLKYYNCKGNTLIRLNLDDSMYDAYFQMAIVVNSDMVDNDMLFDHSKAIFNQVSGHVRYPFRREKTARPIVPI